MKDNIIASKPYSTHPDDSYLSIVVRENHKGEYVTHMYNSIDKGYHLGHYFETLEDAMTDFKKRGV